MGRPFLGYLPFQPLVDAAGLRHVLKKMGHGGNWFQKEDRWTEDDCSQTILSELIGVPRRTVARWASLGVPVSKADEVACALGLNPVEVWGDDWWQPSAEPIVET